MPDCVTTGRCALLHFSEWLDDIDPTIAIQRTVYEAVEPAQGKFPGFLHMCKADCWPAVARRQAREPLAIVSAIRQTGRQLVAFKAGANDYRYIRLRPLAADRGRNVRCVQKYAFHNKYRFAKARKEKGTVRRQPPDPVLDEEARKPDQSRKAHNDLAAIFIAVRLTGLEVEAYLHGTPPCIAALGP